MIKMEGYEKNKRSFLFCVKKITENIMTLCCNKNIASFEPEKYLKILGYALCFCWAFFLIEMLFQHVSIAAQTLV